MTIIMTIAEDIINHHEEKLRPRVYVRVDNFGVKRKYFGEFQKVDMSTQC